MNDFRGNFSRYLVVIDRQAMGTAEKQGWEPVFSDGNIWGQPHRRTEIFRHRQRSRFKTIADVDFDALVTI